MLFHVRRFLHCASLSLAALLLHFPAATAQEMPEGQTVLAAMVFNFLKFTDFPAVESARLPGIRLCTAVRDSRLGEALTALSGRKAGGRELVVSDFSQRGGDCQVLYVDSRQRWNGLTEHPALRHALTISAYPGFAREGGMIEVALLPGGVRFDINLAEGRRAGIHFSPQMLRLARQIHE